MRDVDYGWLLRMTHANMASFFFMAVYLHISRGLYYGSYRTPRIAVWVVGTLIFFLMMATGFLGKLHSPIWSKNSKMNNSYLLYNKNINDKLQKRYYSTNNVKSDLNYKRNSTNSVIVLNFIKDKKLNPVFIYENLHLEEIQKILIEVTKGLSGIYLILNKITLDYYIGSASTDRFSTRFKSHLNYKTGNKVVKRAVIKYDLSNFVFMILELFPEIVNKINNVNLLKLEDFYLKSLLPNYNIVTETGNTFGYKHTDATRLKMKSNYSQERRNKIGGLNKGKSFYKETIERIRQSALKRIKPIYSKEAILNMKKRSKPLLVLNLDGTIFGKYPSLTEATKFLYCSMKTIYRTLRTEGNI